MITLLLADDEPLVRPGGNHIPTRTLVILDPNEMKILGSGPSQALYAVQLGELGRRKAWR